ncbi:MAG: 4Fe-4S dicluster domain-containing protein [Syntrophales bacterium]|jgi:formate dehydrogenase beta subunit|nr:4Fe-4S dicluster domain-containing protein [Syntrophales bacterium]MDY0043876.1 4Fe-4S dicluster domain-containing protein [Syntrophales bacterium]
MSEKVKLFDLSKCIGCRSCQLACKQWNQLPASQTVNWGTYQNPPDLQYNTWLLMRFQEISDGNGGVKWIFRKDACMHCTDAACVKVCPTGALFHTKYGTVSLDVSKCIGCKECVIACPFDVPRYNAEVNKIAKCDMCFSRIDATLEPACVKACPTDALIFGDKKEIVEYAHARAEELGGDASVYGDQFVGGTHLMFVLPDKVPVYEKLPENPRVPVSVIAWKDWLKPLSLIAAGGVLAGSFLHYIIHGPKDTSGNGDAGKGGGE